ncbi:YitT family protein [Verrucomicrobiaceae bacterium 5K15]|uniref:YitT family protein n=1 Tax=Oceaniferula flava TaxID=2800421 RepID=A0AAE2V8L5_9BACT|nr:YitT family protein [Oceaniferula flavus]MBK1853708.1 YitT family protein [Oceaniferula flavus]MBM1135014.1 YitT family protein [Oceaniferula flavus]
MKRTSLHPLSRIALLLTGIMILAWGFNAILATNHIIIGGLPGISLLIERQSGFDPALTQWLVGIPLLGIGWMVLGRQSTLHSLTGALVLPLAIFVTRDWFRLPVENAMLAAIFGGFTCGLGLGIVFLANATTGGMAILAQIVSRQLGIPVSRCMLIIDGIIVIAAGAFFGAEQAMLALLSVVSLSKAIDVVQSGLGSAKSVTIITKQKEAMREMLLHHLDCGATLIKAEGAHSGESRSLLVSVVPRNKVARLRRHVRRVDAEAFTIISDASEVLGYGFQNHG